MYGAPPSAGYLVPFDLVHDRFGADDDLGVGTDRALIGRRALLR